MNLNVAYERIVGALEGVARGDALGLPLEMMTAEAIQAQFGFVTSFINNPNHKWFAKSPAGTVSDDTFLSRALLISLVTRGGFDMDDIGLRHVEAYQEGLKGWGDTTKKAIKNLAQGARWDAAATVIDPIKGGGGNGIAMKVAPLAFYALAKGLSDDELLSHIVDLTKMTHVSSLAVCSGMVQTKAVMYCATHTKESFSADELVEVLIDAAKKADESIPGSLAATPLIENLEHLRTRNSRPLVELETVFGGGACYCAHSLPFTYLHFLQDPMSIQSLYNVVNAGGDTDSNGSMVGALLGALHGDGVFAGAPAAPIAELPEVLELGRKFHAMFFGAS